MSLRNPQTTEEARNLLGCLASISDEMLTQQLLPIADAIRKGDWFMVADWIEEFGNAESQFLAPLVRG